MQQYRNKTVTNELPITVIRPLICYLSAQDFTTISQFFKDDECADCYLEKPLSLNNLTALLKILRIIPK